MSRSIRVALSLATFCCILVLAGENNPWLTKPYTEWSEKETEKLLKNSPWSKTILVDLATTATTGGIPPAEGSSGALGPVPRSNAESCNCPNQEMSNLVLSGSMPNAAGGVPDRPRIPIIVSWCSRPIRQALVRRMQLRNVTVQEKQLDELLRDTNSPFFDILLIGITSGARGDAATLVPELRGKTYLQKKNKEKIPLADLVLPRISGEPLVLRFPRMMNGLTTLTLQDKEVTLVAIVARISLRAKFKLADMVLNGKLEL